MSTVGRNNHNYKGICAKPYGRRTKRLIDFSKIGGLSHHIKVLREIIIFPLIYSNLYVHFNIKPPRGVLFYGPPGTGKTLVAGALAAEMNKECLGRVSFYQRKGADILDKWVGESERKLRELFEKAAHTSPSVIFFDELDGLAPERSQKNDQIHCSVVATLLALMDGLDSMPGVIVIGATNRIDTIDPALRRPGRFDKELYFPLPSTLARSEILQVLIGSWKHDLSIGFLSYLAELTTGYSGSDLNALCAETVLCCMKRNYPQIQKLGGAIKKVKIEPNSLQVQECDFLSAKLNIIPSAHKFGNKMRKLSLFIQPLLSRQLGNILRNLKLLWPHFIDPGTKYILGHERYAGRLLLVGTNLQGLNTHIVPALLHALEHLPAHVLDIPALFDRSDGKKTRDNLNEILQGNGIRLFSLLGSVEFTNKNISNVRQNLPSVLVLSRVDDWWDLMDNGTQIGITAGLEDLHAGLPVLIVATCNNKLPDMLQDYFYNNSSLVIHMEDPTIYEREEFLAPLFFGENNTSVLKILFNKKSLKNNLIKNIKKEKDEYNLENSFNANQQNKTESNYCLRRGGGGGGGGSDANKSNLKRKHSTHNIMDIVPVKVKRINCCDLNKYKSEMNLPYVQNELNKSCSKISERDLNYHDKEQSLGCEKKVSRSSETDSSESTSYKKHRIQEKSNFTTVLTDLFKESGITCCTDFYKSNYNFSFNNQIIHKGYIKQEPNTNVDPNFNKTFNSYGDSKDLDQVRIYKLWQKAAHVTSKVLSVGLLELLYDTIVACINIHKNDFDFLIENLDKALENFEKSHQRY